MASSDSPALPAVSSSPGLARAEGSADPGLADSLDLTGAEAYAPYSYISATGLDGSRRRVGVLVLHGFTGSPTSVAWIARSFADAGCDVELPLLPGHASSPEQMRISTRAQWVGAAEEALLRLRQRCGSVYVFGLSMGGALALLLGAEHPVDGVIVVNPGLLVDPQASVFAPALKHLTPFLKSIGNDIAQPDQDERAYPLTPVASVVQLRALFARTRRALPRIQAPVMAFLSVRDRVVSDRSRVYLAAHLRAPYTVVPLTRSFHVATMDYERTLIRDRALEFIRAQG